MTEQHMTRWRGSKLYKRATKRGIDHAAVKAEIAARFNLTTSRDLSVEQWRMLMRWLDHIPVLSPDELAVIAAHPKGSPA